MTLLNGDEKTIKQMAESTRSYVGVQKTSTLIGQEHILAQISLSVNNDKRTTIIYITGEGGVGKTRLLDHVLSTLPGSFKNNVPIAVATQLIDLYHTRNRSVGGLIEAILKSVPSLNKFIYEAPSASSGVIDTLLDAMSRSEQEGVSSAELLSRRQDLTVALIAKINQFTQKERLLLAIDTAERLYSVRDIAQDQLGFSAQRPIVLDWLLQDFLPKIQNTVVLLAGRPQPLNLTAELISIAQRYNHHFLPLQLKGFTETEAVQYVSMIVTQAKQGEITADTFTSQRISTLNEDTSRIIFHSLHGGGNVPYIRPIILALAIDYLAVEGRPLDVFRQSLKTVKQLPDQERRQIEFQLRSEWVSLLIKYRRPVDELVQLLGLLRKGATVELLAHLTDLSVEEVTSGLEKLKYLAFVKTRSGDHRIFLHDEMYELLGEYSLNSVSPTQLEQNYNVLQNYYEALIREKRRRIDDLYQPEAETFKETLPNPDEVRIARADLQDAITEDLYYRLQRDPQQAFQQYVLYIDEALANNDDILNTLLRAELFGYLAEDHPDELNGLRIDEVTADSAVRWVEWLWSQERFDEALALAERLATSDNHLIKPGGMIASRHLDTWHGYVLIYAGRTTQAEKLLTNVVQELQYGIRPEQRTPQLKAILARAYNSLGYLYDREDRPYDAINAYLRAIPLWKSVQLNVEAATTLNNVAFDRARIGAFAAAFGDAKAGLQLREQLGPRMPVGLSFNTLALIELLNNELTAACRDAERALDIFKRIQSSRGQGLALIALAEATRGISHLSVSIQQRISADLLNKSIEYAEDAKIIFTDLVDEPNRKIEALRELGRTYRTWMRLRSMRPKLISENESRTKKYSVEELYELSLAAFEEALSLIGSDKNMRIEFKIAQAFLHYYFALHYHDTDYELSNTYFDIALQQEIEQSIPEDFQKINDPDVVQKSWYWVQSAILQILKGHIAFHKYLLAYQQKNDSAREEMLTSFVSCYFLGLEFHRYFSVHEFRERRIAFNQVYEHISKLQPEQKITVYQLVKELERRYRIKENQSEFHKFLEERFGSQDIFESML
jgi:hypothetical protein